MPERNVRRRVITDVKEDQHRFLMLLGQLPARLTVEQVAWVLNCQQHDVPVLISARLIKPLGNPPANGIKFFAAGEILENLKERNWLQKVTLAINQHWHKQNARRKTTLRSMQSSPEAGREAA